MSNQPLPEGPTQLWKVSPALWAVIGLSTLAAIVDFYPGLRFMVAMWAAVEEYSYGYFIVPVVAFLIWQRSDRLRAVEFRGAWSGLVPVAIGLLLGALGDISAVRTLSQHGFVIALFGIAACALGWAATRIVAGPLAMLVLMIPLPQFLLREMSQQLQLMSSQAGVWILRLLDVSVFLEGNVIDLGAMKLQVVDACSGLRYMFPLLVLGVIAAHFFRASLWKRVVLVLSTIPLTVIINSLRIAVIGVTADRWGPAMAEGLLHDFEGFFMFMVCFGALVGEMSLLARLGGAGATLRGSFSLNFPLPPPRGMAVAEQGIHLAALAAALMLVMSGVAVALSPERTQIRPLRQPFAGYPLSLDGGWRGRPDRIAPDVVSWLALDDYLLADYARDGGPPINLYAAYYASQSGGESTHSPRTCIPAGGWAILSMAEQAVPLPDGELTVNRAVIEKGGQRQLAYYWFSQRGRSLTNELEVKWYILRDAVVRHRSDGALLRVVTPIPPGESEAAADRRLASFLAAALPPMPAYIGP